MPKGSKALRPCPFCGARGLWDTVNGSDAVTCSNDNCDASVQLYEYPTWNKRALPSVEDIADAIFWAPDNFDKIEQALAQALSVLALLEGAPVKFYQDNQEE